MESSKADESKRKYQKEYFRVTITYSDGGTSGRVFSNREKAEKYAARQKKSLVTKTTKVEPFTRNQHDWHMSRMKSQGKIKLPK